MCFSGRQGCRQETRAHSFMRRYVAFLAIATVVAACTQRPYAQPSTVERTVYIDLPQGFEKQAQLDTAISAAATRAASAKIAGNVYASGEPAYPGPQTAAPSSDPYLVALADAQRHAAAIAKAAGLSLGRITSVREEREFTPSGVQMTYYGRVVLKVDFGDALTVYGSSPYHTLAASKRSTRMTVRINGSGPTAADAQASADAFENAVRSAAASFGIPSTSIHVEGGSVSSFGSTN